MQILRSHPYSLAALALIFLGLSLLFLAGQGLQTSSLPGATISTQLFAPCADCHQNPAPLVQEQLLILASAPSLQHNIRYERALAEMSIALAESDLEAARPHWLRAAAWLAPLAQMAKDGVYEAVSVCYGHSLAILTPAFSFRPPSFLGLHRWHIAAPSFAGRLDAAILFMLLAGMMLIVHRRAPPADSASYGVNAPHFCYTDYGDCLHHMRQSLFIPWLRLSRNPQYLCTRPIYQRKALPISFHPIGMLDQLHIMAPHSMESIKIMKRSLNLIRQGDLK